MRRADLSDIQGVNPKPLSRRALAVAVRHLNAVGPTARILAPSRFLQDDIACFDFFRFRVTALSHGLRERSQRSRGFWNCTLLQAAHLEPAVWHAVAALGAMYRKWEVVSNPQTPPLLTTALETASMHIEDLGADANVAHGPDVDSDAGMSANVQSLRLADQASACYTKALSLAMAVKDPLVLIVLSIGLAATSNLTGKWVESSVHIQAGQKMMGQITSELGGRSLSEAEANAAENLTRLGLEWMSFNEDRARYPYAEDDVVGVQDPSSYSLEAMKWNRASGLHRANLMLTRIVRRILAEAGLVDIRMNQINASMPPNGPDISVTAVTETEKAIVHDLERWERETAQFLSATDPGALGTTLDLLSLKLLHTTARMLVAAGVMRPSHNELHWDACLSHFERLIALTVLILRMETQVNPLLPAVTSLDEPSVNMALWLVCFRCRHPVLRRRALGLLRGARRLEGVWMSTSASAAAEKIIEAEEGCGAAVMAAELPRAFRGDRAAVVERQLVKDIEAEDGGPRSWLGGDGAVVGWTAGEARTRWELPGAEVVPLRRRIAQLDILADYSPRIGKSRGELVLTFADRNWKGESRKQTVTVNF